VRAVPKTGNNLGQFSICAFDETATGLPELSINDVSKNEGDSGTKKYSFTISLNAASANTVKVKYKTLDQTATAPGDYTAVSSTQVIFNPGEVAKTIKITVNGDTTVESDEKFKVKLVSPVNAVIADAIGIGTIKDDDASSFAFSSNPANVISDNRKINIYPNPVKDVLNISIPQGVDVYNIILMDVTGRVLKEISTAGSGQKISFSLSSFSNGNYILTLHSKRQHQSFKFVKQ